MVVEPVLIPNVFRGALNLFLPKPLDKLLVRHRFLLLRNVAFDSEIDEKRL